MKTRSLWFVFVVLTTLAGARAARAADVMLVQDGKDPIEILTPAGGKSPDMAAQSLAEYLEKISGAKFTVKTAPTSLPERAIFVGPVEPADADGLAPHDFRIEAGNGCLKLIGGSAEATEYAVYAFLEEMLGCRWWSWNEEDVPTNRPTLQVAVTNIVQRAPFALHAVWNQEAQNAQNHFAAKLRSEGYEDFLGSHTLYKLLPPYAKEHPEFYPMNKQGERKPNKLHFCYSAPGIAEALADALGKEVEANRRELKRTIYFAGMGDWYGGMCECPVCTKIYEEETWTDPDGRKKPGYSATLLRMINKTAEILETKYPGIRIGTFAYMSLEAPPAKTVPRANVVIRVPRLRHCTVHPAAMCPTNASFRRNLERWCELAPGRVYVWDYGANFENFLYPFPCLFSMADNIQFYARLGIKGIEIQGNYVSTGSDLVVLKNYVWAKLLWNPALDPKALLAEFCRGYYGPAADSILAYVEALEASVRGPDICASEFARPKYLTREVREKMAACRDQAVAATGGREPYLQRVKEATVGLEALVLWPAGPLEERDGLLIRKDIGGYTYPRAKEMVKYLRGAGANEWGKGPAQQLSFLMRQGGPLVTLTRGETSVHVAPAIEGQIRQILYQNQPLLEVETNARAKGYPCLGGSRVYPFVPVMRLAGPATPTNAILAAETLFDDGAISGSPIGSLTMPRENVFRWTQTLGAPRQNVNVVTTYVLGTNRSNVAIQMQSESNTWTDVRIPSGTEPNKLPAAQALRIAWHDKGCQLTDAYDTTGVTGGTVLFNDKQQTVTVALEISVTNATGTLTREITLQPTTAGLP